MKAILKPGTSPNKPIPINISGSKSESNRMLILQAQFPNILIKNISESDDTKALQEGIKVFNGTVDVHHAGTAMRFLTAYFAAKKGAQITLTGSKRMQERPIGILVNALKSLGADIEYLKNEGFPPLKIKGTTLKKSEVKMKADVSSQYISALMLVAPMLSNGLRIILEGKTTSIPYIEMTLSLLKQLGIKGDFNKNEIIVPATKKIGDKTLIVESDWSSASYFYSLVSLSENFKMVLRSFSGASLQGDSALVQIYETLGVQTVFNDLEKTISLSKTHTALPDTLMLDLANTPDLAQTIAVSCFGLGIGCNLSGLHTLKIKETDRLLALKCELEKLGAKIQVDDSALMLQKTTKMNAAVSIETYQDHRMAMAFAPLALKTNIVINEAEVVSKSYPNFWNDLQHTGIFCEFL
ncbi:3-phosphoshikimate 1-carboxyvinyltransferase [Aequorivita sp. Q41]|uniref:3-phosphoshikimate 1-carboxyvinyltransferase n=1 Tax=Aequorivita sp. Q41 TaxID=3153300 RepID=UPI003241D5B4